MICDLLDEIKTKWNIPVTLPMSVPWGKDDVVWLVQEVERLRAEAKRADEEATKLANSDLATTEQIVRALRAENERLREAVKLGMHYLKGRYPIPVKEAEVLAKMQAALDGKGKP